MRIIAGKYKGRQIAFPKHIRPTQDKIRQSIFDVLANVVKGRRVLDLFAGSGALGLEALSRGAKAVWFIDSDKRCRDIIQENIDKLKIGPKEAFNFKNDAFRAIGVLQKKNMVFDLIFLDPPYGKDLAKKALKTLSGSGILATRSFIVAEHSRSEILPDQAGYLSLLKQLRHGETIVSIYVQG